MKWYKNIYVLLTIVLSSTMGSISAQNTMYFMESVPQTISLNPAFQPCCNVFVGLPVFSTTDISLVHHGFSYSDLIHKGTGAQSDSLILDIDNLINSVYKKNYFSPDIRINMLTFGFRVDDMYFSFNSAIRNELRISYPDDLFLLAEGNAAFIDEPFDLNHLGFNYTTFIELGLTFSKQIDDRLTIGIGAKYLRGLVNFQTQKMDITIKTNPADAGAELYKMTMDADIQMNAAFPLDVPMNEDDNVDWGEMSADFDNPTELLKTSNNGFAFDVGASYRFDQQIEFFGSVVDLGMINWKASPNNFIVKDSREFNGINIEPYFDDSDTSKLTDQFTDFLEGFDSDHTQVGYKTNLAPKVYLGATYSPIESVKFGALTRTLFYKDQVLPSLTLSANYTSPKYFGATVSYSMMNGRYDNLGLALRLRLLGVDGYILTDNLLGMVFPHKTENLNLRFGVNLTFGCKKKERVNLDEVPVQDDLNSDGTGSETMRDGGEGIGLEIADDLTITGKVMDVSGTAIPGVDIQVKDHDMKVYTDASGKYELLVPKGSTVLIFSAPGMKKKVVAIKNQSEINVTLEKK